MRSYSFPLAVIATVAFAFTSHAAEKPSSAQDNQNQAKKVWTNEDMDQLRSRGLISLVGPDVSGQQATPSAPSEVAPSAPTFPIYAARLQDPEWYAGKAAELQTELDARQAALQQQKDAIALAADRITQPGLSLDRQNAGVTPAAGIAVLEAQVQEVQSQLDELSDLARQNNVPPSALRS